MTNNIPKVGSLVIYCHTTVGLVLKDDVLDYQIAWFPKLYVVSYGFVDFSKIRDYLRVFV